MLNKSNRDEALKTLENSINNFSLKKQELDNEIQSLHHTHLRLAEKISLTWEFINDLKNKPKELTRKVENIKINHKAIENFVENQNMKLDAKLNPMTNTELIIDLKWLMRRAIGTAILDKTILGKGITKNSKNKNIAIRAQKEDAEVNRNLKLVDETTEQVKELMKLVKHSNENLEVAFNDIYARVLQYNMNYEKINQAHDRRVIEGLDSLVNHLQKSADLITHSTTGRV